MYNFLNKSDRCCANYGLYSAYELFMQKNWGCIQGAVRQKNVCHKYLQGIYICM